MINNKFKLKMKLHNGWKKIKIKNLHIMISIFIEEYIKKIKIMILSLQE